MDGELFRDIALVKDSRDGQSAREPERRLYMEALIKS